MNYESTKEEVQNTKYNALSLRVMLERRSAKGLCREVSLDEMLKQVQHDIVSELSCHNVLALPVPMHIGNCIACCLSQGL